MAEVGAWRENQVKLMPVFRSGVSPGHFVLGIVIKKVLVIERLW